MNKDQRSTICVSMCATYDGDIATQHLTCECPTKVQIKSSWW